MPKLTLSQKFQSVLCVLGVLVASTSQLEVLIGAPATTTVVALAGLLIAMLSGVGAILTGQGQQIKDVVNMAKDDRSAVQGIITTNTPEGVAMARSMPGPIVTAGSAEATELSKS